MNKELFKNIFHIFYSKLIILIILILSTISSQAKTVNVAYFLEWPTPNQEAKVNKTYAKEMNATVRWTNFSNGGAMIDAMLAGDIDIAYSPGIVPFINAVRSNAPIKMVGISVIYGMGGTTCIVSNSSGISKNNAKKLEGKKVAVPLGTMAEYVFDESMKVVGADRKKMDIIQMDPEEGAAALVSGDVVMACLFGGNSIKAATAIGSRLLTVQEARDAGILGIDITSVTTKFMKENPGMLRTFVEVTHEANARYHAGKHDVNALSKASEMKVADLKETLAGMKFLTPEETKESMESGNLHKFLEGMGTPRGNVDTSFLPL